MLSWGAVLPRREWSDVMTQAKKGALWPWLLPVGALVLFVSAYFALLRPVEYAGARPAPAVVGQQLDGQTFDLSSLRDKRAALLVFWASW